MIADGTALIAHPSGVSCLHYRWNPGWVILPDSCSPVTDLLQLSGVGATVFARLRDALETLALTLDDRDLIERVNAAIIRSGVPRPPELLKPLSER